MTGPDHYRKAEELTEKASEYLGQGDGQESAAVWAAVAQIHATLGLAAATSLGATAAGGRRVRLRLAERWPWAADATTAITCLQALHPADQPEQPPRLGRRAPGPVEPAHPARQPGSQA